MHEYEIPREVWLAGDSAVMAAAEEKALVVKIVADLREPSSLDVPPRSRRLIANYIERRWG